MTLISKSTGIPISTNWRRLSTGNGRVRCVGEVIQTTIIAPDGRWIVQAKSPTIARYVPSSTPKQTPSNGWIK